MKLILTITAALALTVIFVIASSVRTAYAEDAQAGEEIQTEVIERVIKIEGSVEKPRVIFIVPKARLWRASITDKDFTEELLRPIRLDK